MTQEENEEFNRIEMESRIKQEYVRSIKNDLPTKEQLLTEVNMLTEMVRGLSFKINELEKNNIRNDVLEEVAQQIEQFTFAFGVDTVHSFASFVRAMKT